MIDVPWTFSAGGEVSERWDWLTDVLAAATGPRQTRRQRQTPRIAQSFESLESGARRRHLEQLLVAHGSSTWGVPLVQDETFLTAGTLAGATVLPVDDTSDRRFRVGGQVLLCAGEPRRYELVIVEDVAPDAITLALGTTLVWHVGTRVTPCEPGRLDAMPTLSRFTGDDVPLRLDFQLEGEFAIAEDAGAATYRGEPVLELLPDWSVEPTAQPERQVMRVDSGVGPVSVIDLPEIPLGEARFAVAIHGRPALTAFRELLYALAGRWGAIWVPTFAQDLLVTGALVAASAQLDVEWSGLQDLELMPNRRDLRIELADGTVLYRRITAVVGVDDDTERLTLDSALGVNAAASAVASVSYLVLSSQDTDVNLLRHWSDELVLSELTFRGILDDGV